MIHDWLWWSNVGFQIPIHPWTEAPCVSCQELMLSMLCEGTSMLMPLCSYHMLGCCWILQATCNVMRPPIKLFLGGTTHWSSNQLPEALHSFSASSRVSGCHEGSSPMISETTCAGSKHTRIWDNLLIKPITEFNRSTFVGMERIFGMKKTRLWCHRGAPSWWNWVTL